MSALRHEAQNFANIAAREIEDMITDDDVWSDEIFLDPDADEDGNAFILIRTSANKVGALSAKFSDSVQTTVNGKTKPVSLIIRPLEPKAGMN